MRTNMLIAGVSVCLTASALADDWPQWRGARRDGVWREMGIVEKFKGQQLNPEWRTPIGGGYAGPSVADGRVYVTDRQKERDTERVLCLDARTGAELWKHEYACVYQGVDYDAGPRATPTVHDGNVYAVGAMGNLFCIDVRSGKVIWQKDYVKEYGAKIPQWGMASAPLVDGPRLIAHVGGKDGAAVMAFDRNTGEEIWRAMTLDNVGYAPPMIYEVGGVRQLIFWHPEAIVSLNPETGKVYWQQPFHTEMGVSILTPTLIGDLLFVSQSWGGPMVLRLAKDKPTAEVAYHNPPGSDPEDHTINCLMSTPQFDGDYMYGVALYGALRCLKVKTGERVWETHDATGEGRWWNAFLTPNGDRTFIANEQGELIIARLTPKGYDEISRAGLIEPTNKAGRRSVVWSHPAYANRSIYARNDKEILCVPLAADGDTEASAFNP